MDIVKSSCVDGVLTVNGGPCAFIFTCSIIKAPIRQMTVEAERLTRVRRRKLKKKQTNKKR